MIINETSNYLYYTNNSKLNDKIDDILSFHQFINSILGNLKIGRYNKTMIEMLSKNIKSFYSSIQDNLEIYNMDNNKANHDNEDDNLDNFSLDTETLSDCESDDKDMNNDLISELEPIKSTELIDNKIDNNINKLKITKVPEIEPSQELINNFFENKLEFKYYYENNNISSKRLNLINQFI